MKKATLQPALSSSRLRWTLLFYISILVGGGVHAWTTTPRPARSPLPAAVRHSASETTRSRRIQQQRWGFGVANKAGTTMTPRLPRCFNPFLVSQFATRHNDGASLSPPKGDDEAEDSVLVPHLTDNELAQILALHPSNNQKDVVIGADDDDAKKEENDPETQLMESVRTALPTLSPRLMVKLRQLEAHSNPQVSQVSKALNTLLHQQLDQATDLLKQLLNAGEIRLLDSLIGKAGRDMRLNPAFFQVLSYNLQDAAAVAAAAAREDKAEMPRDGNDAPKGDDDNNNAPGASRYQVLQHIYTRCQEEVEKTIPPAVALLNKLLRTEQPSIRSNLVSHYLTPSSTVIKSPDGSELQLSPTSSTVLVPLSDFVEAIAEFVEQIRTVEAAGGTDRAAAASMVEACRQVAKEVRVVVANHYGTQSPELLQLQDGLQPVFRPSSTSSPYIQGKV